MARIMARIGADEKPSRAPSGAEEDARCDSSPAMIGRARVPTSGRPPEATLLKTGDLFENTPAKLRDEAIATLAEAPGVRIERIVSTGQASPPGFWYDQDATEWVVLLAGSAGLLFEGEVAPRVLRPGAYVEIPAHLRHRVEWTDPERPTVWLAVHFGG